ncbi:MAG: phytanoyl-CoA dioxygenase family protein [Candidatus Latescibacterota bacterium]|nr:phytanoyl-CoA dioxygenase family protein [Candidatus Latescibacterota bacterium]
MNLDKCDWDGLTIADRIRQIEVEGYFVVPNILARDQVKSLKAETAQLETRAVDYSVHQQTFSNVQWQGGELAALIGHRPTLDILENLLGKEIIFSHYSYARSEPGHPGISLHTDGQPYGSRIFGYEGSVPVMVRVLYYLDDLTPEVAPFRVIPRSHLSLHRDANPYQRFASHPEEVTVTTTAGSAVFLNHKVFHGNQPNTGDRPREMLAIAYRPAWAGPVSDVEEWTTDQLATFPPEVKPLLASRNTRHWDFGHDNKPEGMRSDAPGINPSRWDSQP